MGEAGDEHADLDDTVTATGWLTGFGVAALALVDGDPLPVAAGGLVAGAVGLGAWIAIRRGRDRTAVRGQVGFVAVAAAGGGVAVAADALLVAAALGLVALMVAGRLYEKWRA